MSDILKVLKSLVSDIEAMQSPGPHDSYWFGEFSTYQEDRLNDTVAVMWPNLAISLEEAKKAIAEAEQDEWSMSGPEEGDSIDTSVFVTDSAGHELIRIEPSGDIEADKELGRRIAEVFNKAGFKSPREDRT